MTQQGLLERLATVSTTRLVDAGGDGRAVAGELFGPEAQRRGLAGLVVALREGRPGGPAFG